MATFEESWISIAPLWAAVNDADGRLDGASLVIDGGRQTLAPSREASGEIGVFLIQTADVGQPPQLPEGADLVEAPLGTYDAVELTLFGRPAAKARIAFGDGLAVVGNFEFEAGTTPDDLGPAVLSALAEEAFLEGAAIIYTVAEGAEAPSFLGTGWHEVGRLRRV